MSDKFEACDQPLPAPQWALCGRRKGHEPPCMAPIPPYHDEPDYTCSRCWPHIDCGCKAQEIHTCTLGRTCNRVEDDRRDPTSRGAQQRSPQCGVGGNTCEAHCLACNGVPGCSDCDGTGLMENTGHYGCDRCSIEYDQEKQKREATR